MDPTSTSYPTGAVYGEPAYGNQSPTISVGDWLITLLISAVPLVGIVMLFVWAFGSGTPRSKANYAKATLIFFAIFIVLGILFAGSFMALLMKAGGANNPYR